MRTIEFRAWDKQSKQMYFNIRPWYGETPDYNKNEENTELMQFTGLLDNNGKEIYEGDITDLGVVEWSQPTGAWILNGVDTLLSKKYIEVIGNIWEHPELINDYEA